MSKKLSLTEIVERQKDALKNHLTYNAEAVGDLNLNVFLDKLREEESHVKITYTNTLATFFLHPIKDLEAIRFRREISEILLSSRSNTSMENLLGVEEESRCVFSGFKGMISNYISSSPIKSFQNANSTDNPDIVLYRLSLNSIAKSFNYKNLLTYFNFLDISSEGSKCTLFTAAKEFAVESINSDSYKRLQTIENIFAKAHIIDNMVSIGCFWRSDECSSIDLLKYNNALIKGSGLIIKHLTNNQVNAEYDTIISATTKLKTRLAQEIDLNHLEGYGKKLPQVRGIISEFMEVINSSTKAMITEQTRNLKEPDWAFLHDEVLFLIRLNKYFVEIKEKEIEVCIPKTGDSDIKNTYVKNANNIFLAKTWKDMEYYDREYDSPAKIKSLTTNDIISNRDAYVILLTGPNDGGKSTLLRTIGMIAWHNQLGGAITASEAEVDIYNELYTLFMQGDKPEEELSKYAVDLNKAKTYFTGPSQINSKTLFLVDEFGNGTNKEESSVRTSVIVDQSVKREATTYISFHKQDLAKALSDTFTQVVCLGLDDTIIDKDTDKIEWNHKFISGKISLSYGNLIRKKYGVSGNDLEKYYEQYVILRDKEANNKR